MTYDDLDEVVSALRVTAKPLLGLIPKKYHERTVPVARFLTKLLLARRKRRNANQKDLIFGTSTKWVKRGSVGAETDRKMLEKLKQIG